MAPLSGLADWDVTVCREDSVGERRLSTMLNCLVLLSLAPPRIEES
jgi:hypothetical protein